MAQKRSRLVEDPPAPSSSSSSEEEEGEEEEESTPEESSEEEEDEQKNISGLLTPPTAVDKKASSSKLVATPPSKQPATQSSSPEDEEDGSESDSEPESQLQNPRSSRAADPTIKPIATKPMEETPKSKKARSKPEASVTPSPVKLPTSKRQPEVGVEKKESKRAKKEEPEPDGEEIAKKIGEDTKKLAFQRIWSEDDEIAFLKGIAEYSANHGCVPYPNGDMNEFHYLIRNSLHGEFSKGQLTDKLRRLKKKYENSVSRAKSGEDPTFQKPHDQKAFELSKRIWAVEGNISQQSYKGNGKARKNQKPKAKEESEVLPVITGDIKEAVRSVNDPKSEPPKKRSSISVDFARLNKSVGLSPTLDRAIEIGLGLLSESVKADLEDKLEEIQEQEFQLHLKKAALIQMLVKAAMHAFRSRNQ